MMRCRTLMLLLMVLLLAPAAAQVLDEDTSSPALRIGWVEFKKLYDANKIAVVDVRGDAVFELGHIPGARSVALDDIEKNAAALGRLKRPIVLYCA